MSDNSRWEPFTKDIDAWNYLSLPTFPTVRGKGPEYRKPISIDEFLEGRDSTPKELIDLRTDFFNQKDKIRKSISVPFEGGRFVASPNTSIFRESDDPIIKYYFDNSEADAAAAADTQDLESIQSIYSTIGGVAAGLASAKPKPPNIVLKTNKGKVEIPVTENLGRDSANMNRMLTDILIKRTDKIIPKYSSGPIVQTNEGTMYRPVPGTMQSTFESMRKRKGESESQFSNRYFDAKFQKIGLNEDAILSLKNMLDAKNVTQRQRRELKTGISNPNYSMKTYKQTRQILVDEFLNGLEFLGLSPKDIEAHHITGLRQTASLFEGLQRSEFPEMLQLIYDEGLTTGNDPRNLMAIQKKAHYNKKDNPNITAVHTYLTKELGLYGQKIVGDFGVDIRDLSPQERIPYIKKFAAVVKGSYPVAEKAIRAVLDENVMDASPEALVDASLDIDKSQVKIIKAAIDDYITLQLTEPNHQALLDSIFGDESAGETMRRRGIKPRTPIQSQLLDLGKKPPRKTKEKPKDIKPGTGAYWDIESE